MPTEGQHEDGLEYSQRRGPLELSDAGTVQKAADREIVKELSNFLLYFELTGNIHLCSSLLILLVFSQSQYTKKRRAFHVKY